ncbi:MAG: hypothetical protein N3A62_01530 [Thermodesulfovibrionales bacterium]|nr:hypothetical protein [Thermodesulfovibrionales bacterium]
MPITLPIQAYEVLAAKHGKEEAKVLVEAFETVIESVLNDVRLKTKLELKQELTKELVTRELFEERMSRMATKEDLANLRAELKQDIADLRAEFKQDIANIRVEFQSSKAEIIKWVAAMLVAQAAAIAALVKLL